VDAQYVPVNRGAVSCEHVAFDALQPVNVAEFDFEAVERGLGEHHHEPDDGAADELASLLQWIWESPGDLSAARPRFEALSREALAHPSDDRAAIVFTKLLEFCATRKSGSETPFRKFVALSATLDPKLVAAKSYVDLARELGVTKAAISNASRNFRDHFHVALHEWRPREGRERMRRARLAQRLPDGKVVARNIRPRQ
jgi:hypothetical protein